MIVAVRKAGRRPDRHGPGRRRVARGRRRPDRGRHGRRDPRARRAVRTAEGRCRLGRSTASPTGSDRLQARRSSSSARRTPSTATTRRTSRCGSRPSAAGRRASSPRSSRRRPRRCPASSAPRSPGPGFLNLFLEPAWFGEALAEMLEAGDEYGARQRRSPRSGSRSRWSRRTRPARSPSRAPATGPTATRSRACSRSPATTVEREYYYNDAGAQMDRFRASVEARRRGEEPPEDGYHGAYIARARAPSRATPCRGCSSRSRRRLERFRIHFDTWVRQSELERARSPSVLERLETYEADGAVWAPTRATATTRTASLIRSDGELRRTTRPTSPISRDKLGARLRPRDLRARRRPPRLRRSPEGGRGAARRRPGAGRGADLPARPSHEGRRGDARCRSAAATSSSSTS